MRAGYYVGNHSYEVRDIPDREPEGDEVKIRVAWCGLCGTDVRKFNGKSGASQVIPPIILGHECSGIVEKAGADCSRFKPGDRVACDPSWSCGSCEWCKKGFPHFCENRHGVAKGFAEYVYPPERNVYPIADDLDLETAAFAEPLSCVIHGIDLLHMESGKRAALFGMGSIGALALQLLKISGAAEIIVVEREESKRKLALELGASKAVTDLEIEETAAAGNIDYVIECIGLKNTMEQAIRVAGKNAKVLLFGLGEPGAMVSFDQFEAYTKELSIYTSYLNPCTTARAIALLESGSINVRKIISAECSLEEIGDELKTPRYAKQGKVMVALSGEQ